MTTTPLARPLFAAYSPTALNDTAAPPFPAREADEEQEPEASGAELEYERPQQDWAPIAPGEPTADVPVRFVDGSIASRMIGFLRVDYQLRPLIAGVVSAAALEIVGRRLERGAGSRTRKALCVFGDGIDVEEIRYVFSALAERGIELLVGPEGTASRDFDSMRRSTHGIAMQAMEEAERSVMLSGIRDGAMMPTLMDGLLERRLANTPSHNVPVVGLVKRQMATYLPSFLQQLLYALKPGERTPAFVLRTAHHVDLVNTYVRLSSQPGASPSYGIVRVTAPLAYVESAHASDVPAYLSGLAAYLYRLRHRDLAYARSGISVEPIARVEDHLHAILPDLDALIPRLHRFLQPTSAHT